MLHIVFSAQTRFQSKMELRRNLKLGVPGSNWVPVGWNLSYLNPKEEVREEVPVSAPDRRSHAFRRSTESWPTSRAWSCARTGEGDSLCCGRKTS